MQKSEFIAAIYEGKSGFIATAHLESANFHFNQNELEDLVQISAVKGYQQLLEALVDTYHFDVNTVFENRSTALHAVTEAGNLNAVNFLLKKGAEQLPDGQGNYPIHLATLNHHFLLPYLLKNAHPDQFVNHQMETPFDVAVKNNKIDAAKYLKDKKSSTWNLTLEAVRTSDYTILVRLNSLGCEFENVHSPDSMLDSDPGSSEDPFILVHHEDLLSIAAQNNSETAFVWLHKVKNLAFNTSIQNHPMMIAVHHNSLDVLRCAMQFDPKLAEKYIGNEAYNVAMFAAYEGNLDALKLIHKYNPNALKKLDKNNKTIFHYAIENNNHHLIAWLVNDVFKIDFDSNPKLLSDLTFRAIRMDNINAFRWLCEEKNIPLSVTHKKQNVLLAALKEQSFNVVKYLFEYHFDAIHKGTFKQCCQYLNGEYCKKHQINHAIVELLIQSLANIQEQEHIDTLINSLYRYYQNLPVNKFAEHLDFLLLTANHFNILEGTLKLFNESIQNAFKSHKIDLLNTYANTLSSLIGKAKNKNADILFDYFSKLDKEQALQIKVDVLLRQDKIEDVINICLDLFQKDPNQFIHDKFEIARITLADLILQGRFNPKEVDSPLQHFQQFNTDIVKACQAFYYLNTCQSSSAKRLQEKLHHMLESNKSDEIQTSNLIQKNVLFKDKELTDIFTHYVLYKQNPKNQGMIDWVNECVKEIASNRQKKQSQKNVLIELEKAKPKSDSTANKQICRFFYGLNHTKQATKVDAQGNKISLTSNNSSSYKTS